MVVHWTRFHSGLRCSTIDFSRVSRRYRRTLGIGTTSRANA